jgi:predicted nucleotidyltransferase
MLPRESIEALARSSGIQLLALFGSRARGEAHALSDFDFAYRANATTDVPRFESGLLELLGTDRLDLVNLDRASALLRRKVAQEGVLLFQAKPSGFQDFQIEAAQFWCENVPVFQEAYRKILAALDRP